MDPHHIKSSIETRRSSNNDTLGIEGIVVRYGEITSRTRLGKEQIQAGAFGDVSNADVVLNRQHDRGKPLARTGSGGLQLIDSATELRAVVNMPSTQEARDAWTLVESGVLRGFSVEMRVSSESVQSGVRIITGAKLVGLGLVDTPAYRLSKAKTRSRTMPLWAY